MLDQHISTTSAGRQHVHHMLASARAAGWTHAATLVVGAVVLIYVGRGQWFYFDEWDFMWQPEALRRLVEGHNGHWSLVPISAWLLLQQTFGLGSYLPFLLLAIVAHLVLAHLLWRVLQRVRCQPWLATGLATAFIFFGTATENLMWAFQFGYMGAIAFALGALLLVSRPALRLGGAIGAAALLTLGAATAGTALPFFVPVALTALVVLGWKRALIVAAPPTLIYLFWYLAIAGENPTVIYRATGVGDSLRGIPEFMSRMYVDGLGQITPVPLFGIVLLTAVATWAVLRLRRRLDAEAVIVLGMLAAGIVFAGLTAYSRLGVGPGGGTAPRYVYLVVVSILPAVGVMLTRLVAASAKRLLAISALIAVVIVFNAGALISISYTDSDREQSTRGLISAALDLADEYPDRVNLDARPDPVFVPPTLGRLQVLETDFGLTRGPYSPSQRLSALVNVGVALEPVDVVPPDCTRVLVAGDKFTASASGSVLRTDGEVEFSVAALGAGVTSSDGTITLEGGPVRLVPPFEVDMVVRSSDLPVFICTEGATR